MRFCLLLLLACPLNAPAAETPTAEEKAAMDFVARSGGSARLDPKLGADARVMARFETLTDSILAGLKKYPQIGGVEALDATPCTFKGLATLKELPGLRKLTIDKGTLTAAAAAAIGQCKELRYLTLQYCNLTDAQLEQFKSLKLLEQLTLSHNPKITDKGMRTVKEFDRLQLLYLNNTALTDQGLMELKGLDGLRKLAVVGTAVTQEAADKFADDMPNLRAVRR